LPRCAEFTRPAIAGLSLDIVAATAVFRVFSAMLLRSMVFDDARRIVAIWATDEPHAQKHVEVCFDDMLAWRSAGAVEDAPLASSVNLDFAINAGGVPEHLGGTTVTGSFFRVLGAAPVGGRL